MYAGNQQLMALQEVHKSEYLDKENSWSCFQLNAAGKSKQKYTFVIYFLILKKKWINC